MPTAVSTRLRATAPTTRVLRLVRVDGVGDQPRDQQVERVAANRQDDEAGDEPR